MSAARPRAAPAADGLGARDASASGQPDPQVGLSLRPGPGSPYSLPSGTAAMIAPMPCGVLVVDDDEPFRGLARRMLLAEGLVVVGEADSVATAVAAAHALRPEAMLVDVGLPDGDGVALARELTGLPWRPRVVLTSTDPQAASEHAVRAAGAGAFVPKDQLPNAPLRQLLSGS
jgi:CheY-like chemotaxis protein